MGEAVIAKDEVVRNQALADGRVRGQDHGTLGIDRTQVLAHREEHRRHTVLLQDRLDLKGVLGMRSVIGGEGDGLLGEVGAEELGLAISGGGGERLGDDETVVLQDALTRIERLQMGDVVVPALAFGDDRARLKDR